MDLNSGTASGAPGRGFRKLEFAWGRRSSGGQSILPWLIVSDHAVEDRQEFPHASYESQFFGFPFLQQGLIETFDEWVMLCSDECSHVERSPHRGPACHCFSIAGFSAAVVGDGSDACKFVDLASIEFSEFGHL